jgi:hypothetical protein
MSTWPRLVLHDLYSPTPRHTKAALLNVTTERPHSESARLAPSLPLTGEVELDVHVFGAPPYIIRTRVRLALAELPSVGDVLAAQEGSEAQLRLTTCSLAALLTEIGASPALTGSEITLIPSEGLTLRLPETALVAATGEPLPVSDSGIGEQVSPPVGGLRGALNRMRERWRMGATIARVLAVPVLITLAVAPHVSRAPSETVVQSLPARERPVATAAECIQQAGNRPCDAETAALWEGDPEAWRAKAARDGEPAPTPEEVTTRTIALRLSMGDPKTRVDIAEKLTLPAMFLTAAAFGESGNTLDIEVEIANLGAAGADLSGARIEDGTGTAVFVLPDGAQLPAGERCRLTTTPPADSLCTFTPTVVQRPTGNGSVPLTLRARDGERLDTLDSGVGQ